MKQCYIVNNIRYGMAQASVSHIISFHSITLMFYYSTYSIPSHMSLLHQNILVHTCIMVRVSNASSIKKKKSTGIAVVKLCKRKPAE